MSTHRDIVQRATLNAGMRRAGQSLQGSMYAEMLTALQQVLLAWSEHNPFDFDPADDDAVPDERVGYLADAFMYEPIFNPYDNDPQRIQMGLLARQRLFTSMIGESDYVHLEPRDF